MRILAASLVGLLFFVPGAIAADEPTLGRIDFPTSGRPAAQPHFVRGVLLLHSFEYDDAAEAFREAQQVDPAFALAYWGEALTYTHLLWNQQDTVAGRAVLARLGDTPEARAARAPTARERAYLATVEVLYGPDADAGLPVVLRSYERAMRRLAADHPDDDEAQAFHALSILATNVGRRRFNVDARAAAIVEEVFARNPDHPGALHYLIHAYDSPVMAPLGLRPARRYGRIAAGAAHALHMTSHIFVALGMWDDATRANEASWAASAARVRRKGLGVDRNGFHAYLWLAYSYLQQGRVNDARRVVDHTAALARQSGSRGTAYHHALARAYFIVESGEWSGPPPALDSSLVPAPARAAELFAEGFAALQRGSPDEASARLEALSGLADVGADDAHHGPARGLSQAEREGMAITAMQLEGLLAIATGDEERGVERLRAAVAAEDVMPYEYGPPFPIVLSRELLGEALLAMGQPKEAQEAFALALERAPRRKRALEGLASAAAAAGDAATAAAARAELTAMLGAG